MSNKNTILDSAAMLALIGILAGVLGGLAVGVATGHASSSTAATATH